MSCGRSHKALRYVISWHLNSVAELRAKVTELTTKVEALSLAAATQSATEFGPTEEPGDTEELGDTEEPELIEDSERKRKKVKIEENQVS
jgi:hypothetical protein